MLYPIKRFTRNFKDWFPILKQDEQWDNEYLLDVLDKKLELMEKFHRSDKTWAMRHLETAQEIKYARLLIERIQLDNYLSIVMPDWNEYINQDNHTESEKKRFLDSCIEEQRLKEQDIQKLFKHIADNIQKWWD